jgi:hypothetical protein
MFGTTAHAQNRDWQAVQNLKPGTRISIKAQERYLCTFENASQDELTCEGVHPRVTRQPSRISIPRREIREVRLPPNQAKYGWIGVGIGAGVGAAGGLVGVLGGAAAGGILGTMVPIFRRGKVIYEG